MTGVQTCALPILALRMSDVSGGCVNIDIGTMNGFSCNLVVKSQQDDSINSGIIIRNLCCELLVYVF